MPGRCESPVEPLRRRKHKSLVGLGTQDLAVYPELTARENLTFFGKLYGLNGSDLPKRVNDILAAVGLLDRADHRTCTFSGGMKRRLNLAAAVVHGPKLLLLDEPTTGVDPQSRNHIYEQVKSLNAAGMTIVYTSHYMEEVQMLCPRIAILDAGKVVACDTIKNLLTAMPATAKLTVDKESPELLDKLRAIPGVKKVTTESGAVTLEATTLGPVLPMVAGVCHNMGIHLRNLETTEPNLERVFLHLTGKTLRD